MADKDTTPLERLSAVQIALKVPKAQRNTFGNYNFRNAEDILEAVKPLLAANGLTLTMSDELVQVGERYYVKAVAKAHAIEAADDKGFAHATGYAREEETKKGMDGSQITGAASSYARKYALNGLFLIDDTKDSDATNDHGKKPSSVPTTASKDKARALLSEHTKNGESATDIIRTILDKDKPETESDMQKLIEALDVK